MTAPKVERVLCSNVLSTEQAHRESVFRHPLFAYEEALPWPPANWRDICCWHCCHKPTSTPICLPNSYDRKQKVYHVFGYFCSLPCAKAHLLESTAFGAGDRMLLLHHMAVEIFGHSGRVIAPAPPRHRLTMFGGDLTYEQFRTEHEQLCVTSTPPLISTPEVYERLAVAAAETWAARGIVGGRPATAAAAAVASVAGPSAPNSASLFGSFTAQRKRATTPALEAEARPEEAVAGTLQVFMKRRK